MTENNKVLSGGLSLEEILETEYSVTRLGAYIIVVLFFVFLIINC